MIEKRTKSLHDVLDFILFLSLHYFALTLDNT
jgi:hypothetical protein